jgi:ribonuclease R
VVPSESELLGRLRRKGSRILTFGEIASAFNVRPAEQEALRERLATLVRHGEIVRVRGEKYSAIEFTNMTAGRLSVRPEGYGFVLTADRREADLFVPRSGMHGALDGDVVLAREERARGRARRDDRISGTVVEVLQRARERIVGRFDTEEGRLVVFPYDPRIDAIVRVPPEKTAGASRGEIVEVLLTAFPDRRRIAQGIVEERIGFLGEPGVDVEIVVRSHNLPHRFPEQVVAEAEAYPDEVDPREAQEREDFRHHRIVTIDGETARDFDDAVEVERTPSGYRLGVHIADVSHYVAPGTLLDDEARGRGTSVYFPGRVVPMLPEKLSNGLCSLNPGVDRLVVSAIIDFDEAGRVQGARFVRGIIRSLERMTYTEVARLLAEPTVADEIRYGALLPDFRLMGELAEHLRRRREARGAIDFDLPDADVILDNAGVIVGIVPEVRNVAHRIIEEFMLAANEAVARHMHFAAQPAIYRVHDRPDPDRLVELREILASFDLELKGDLAEVPPSEFRRLLLAIEGRPEERLLTDLLLRAQQKAVYAEECRGHYALAAPFYCHFTSPIRRYPDLVVHRMLTRLLAEGRPVAPDEREEWQARFAEVAREASERERRAADAEREALLWKKIVFLKDKIGRSFDAFVTGVAPFGVFVTLAEFFVEGLVPVQALGNDFFVYEEKWHRLRGRSSGAVFRLGDLIRVVLTSIDEVKRRVDFRLAAAESPARRRPRRPVR